MDAKERIRALLKAEQSRLKGIGPGAGHGDYEERLSGLIADVGEAADELGDISTPLLKGVVREMTAIRGDDWDGAREAVADMLDLLR